MEKKPKYKLGDCFEFHFGDKTETFLRHIRAIFENSRYSDGDGWEYVFDSVLGWGGYTIGGLKRDGYTFFEIEKGLGDDEDIYYFATEQLDGGGYGALIANPIDVIEQQIKKEIGI